MDKKTLLQVRPSYPGLMTTCNSYLDAFNNQEYCKIVVFLSGKAEPHIAAQVPADKVIFLELQSTQLKGFRIRAVRRLLQVCRDTRVHIVLAHRYKSTYIMATVALCYSPRLMLSIMHGLDPFKTLSRRLIARTLLRKQFKFIGVSQAVCETILQSGVGISHEDVLALPNCIDVESTAHRLMSRQEARRSLALDHDDFVIGTVGRLSPRKDQITLLRAFAKAKAQIPGGKVLIVGDGRLRPTLQEEARRLHVDPDVTFAGPISDAYRVMPAFDLFALTSVAEGLPRVLLEAMVCKLPIIATDAGGIREVLDDLIDLYPPGDAPLISKAFVEHYAMTEEDRAKIGEKLFHHLQISFSTTAFRKRLLEFVTANS